MSEARTYPSGVPCWVDVEPPDPQAARAFYGPLFGWTFDDVGGRDASSAYTIARLDGRDVAGMAAGSGSVTGWNTYIAVDDPDRVAGTVVRAGGRVVHGPEDADGAGRTAVALDPTGAAFRLWQPRRRLGAQVVNVPGAWNFSDLHTADLARAKSFYATVFGWETDDVDLGGGMSTTMWRRPGYGDHLAATVDRDIYERQKGVGAPPGFADAIAWLAGLDDAEQAHWHVTFTVADRDAVAARAVALGATDLSGPIDTAWTKAAQLRDPQGAVFTVSQFSPPAP
jgi:predicted enzyme related to lactoylglutathione lyase